MAWLSSWSGLAISGIPILFARSGIKYGFFVNCNVLRKMYTLSNISLDRTMDNVQDSSHTKNKWCISRNSGKYENIVDLIRNISCNGNIFLCFRSWHQFSCWYLPISSGFPLVYQLLAGSICTESRSHIRK